MALAINDIYSVQLRGDLLGQQIITSLHYATTVVGTAPSEGAYLADLADTIEASGALVPLVDKYIAGAAQNYTLQTIRTQRVYPTRTVYVEAISATPGGIVEDANTSNIAASILKKTLLFGREGIGRMQYAPVPPSKMLHGEVTAAYASTELLDIANAMIMGITTTAFASTLVPCLYTPNQPPPKFAQLFSAQVKLSLRTMHRRTLRVGE